MKIIICEDQATLREEIRRILSKLFFEEEDVAIRCFEDGDELIRAVEEENDFFADIVFMDIKMPKLDGIQTAKRLRKKFRDVAIVFLTVHGEYVFLGYEVHAYDFILKPVSERKLRKVVKRFLEERQYLQKEYLMVKKKGGKKKIPLEHVRYFVSDKRKITAVLAEPYESVEFYMTMRELEEHLRGLWFLRCHQSFLINSNKVTDWNLSIVVSEGGVHIPVSKKYRECVNQSLIARNGYIYEEKF